MRYFTTYLFLILMCLISNCDIILESDISSLVVPLKAPSNNTSTKIESQTFWWDFVEGATFYNIQIVSPSFDATQQLIIDTEVETNTFEQSLSPGDYEWTVIAYNDSYISRGEIYKLTIEEDSTLDNQSILLVNPIDNTITNENPIQLLWQSLSIANQYFVQVASPDFTNSTFIVTEETTPNDYLDLTDLDDGTYQWRVKGQNTDSETDFASNSFIVDRTPPTAPILNTPNNATILPLNTNINLSWTSDNDAVIDTLVINRDLGQGEENILTLPTTDFSYTFIDSTSTTNQIYFWKVKSVDAVGNISQSNQREFYLQ